MQRPSRRHRLQGHPRPQPHHGQKTANRIIAAGRAPVEHGFAHLKTWRILTKLRTSPARAAAPAKTKMVDLR
ncbi:transposase family protein [Streptomyces sp. NPDC002387]|uniref:transposase family protein n=1 Tax=unclassified Streptomyces TaxID=2593676 RepID=UPI0034449BC0